MGAIIRDNIIINGCMPLHAPVSGTSTSYNEVLLLLFVFYVGLSAINS